MTICIFRQKVIQYFSPMKKSRIIKLIVLIVYIFILFTYTKDTQEEENYDETIIEHEKLSLVTYDIIDTSYIEKNYYNGELIEDIINKINKVLSSTLTGKGEFIVRYSIEKNVDPYLTSAVILHETGCQWTCSYLARVCNNYGGNKGGPSCNGGSYRRFDTAEEGLKFAIDKLSRYYNSGLTTPEEIGPKYAMSDAWPLKVNKYINKLKNQ